MSVCLVINPITVDNFAALYLHASGLGVRLYDGLDLKLFILVVGTGALSSVADLLLLQISSSVLFGRPGISICHANSLKKW